MPFRTSRTRRQHYDVLRDTHFSMGDSRIFDRSYIPNDANNERWVYAGLIVAVDSSTSMYVPYSAGASYGSGSDTPVGVLKEPYDLTYGSKVAASVWHATLVEEYCYVFGAGLGSIPAAVKTALDDINWT